MSESRALSSAQKDALDKILTGAVSSKSTPALFFGVTNAEGLSYLRAEGTRIVDDPSSGAIDEDTLFWLCSQTKLITTIAALQLVEQGKIALDTPVETVLPELANPLVVTAQDETTGKILTTTPAKGKILFGHLLNHTSGLDYTLDETAEPTGPSQGAPSAYVHHYKDGEGASKFLDIVKGSLSNVPLRFEPGTNFAYGVSIGCAGFVIERLSGKTLGQYFQDHIFSPLGITNMMFSLTPTQLKERLLPLSYRNKRGGVESWKGPDVIEQDRTAVTLHQGGGGLYASLKDYLTILRHLLQISAGNAPANAILSRASVDSMFTPTLPPAVAAQKLSPLIDAFQPHLGIPDRSAQFGYGLCINTVDIPGKRRKGTGTWSGWAGTCFFVDRTAGLAAVLGTQLLPTCDDITYRTLDALEKVIYADWENVL
ncbi:beta-lactamase/transpeptidase-like protein [Favolaschia claudopus]|uniref:Beta-lactamase/transpeptidase-like protein n=1 Tax=Favolaschia claudopus TaxID=2862362 RepID=A0AAW0AUK7_9AGAR